MYVKDLKIEEVKGIANARYRYNKKLCWTSGTNIINYIFCILFLISFCAIIFISSNREYIYTNDECKIATSTQIEDYILIDNDLYFYDRDLNKNIPLKIMAYICLLSFLGIMFVMIKLYSFDKPGYRRKFLQYWKDTGDIPNDKDIGY